MTAKEAIYEMRKWDATKAANRSRLVPMDQWADAIEAELAAKEKMLHEMTRGRMERDARIAELEAREARRHTHRWSYSEPIRCLDCGVRLGTK